MIEEEKDYPGLSYRAFKDSSTLPLPLDLFTTSLAKNYTSLIGIKKQSKHKPRRNKELNRILEGASEYKVSEKNKRLRNIDKSFELVDYVWGLIVCISTLYNYLLFFFYLGIPGAPGGAVLVCEILAELILIIDAFTVTHLYFNRYEALKTILVGRLTSWTSNERVSLVIVWVASFPQHTFYLLTAMPPKALSSFPFALLRGLKLLRYPEVWSYFNFQLRYVKGVHAIYIRMFHYIINIFMLIHAMALLCLAVVRLEPNNDWLREYNFDRANSLEIYTQFLLLATSNMGGMCYGDIPPVTVSEALMYCLIVYVGATALASLFGSFANSIYISNQRHTEMQRKLEQIRHFVESRNLSLPLKQQLLVYYSTMHLGFSQYGNAPVNSRKPLGFPDAAAKRNQR